MSILDFIINIGIGLLKAIIGILPNAPSPILPTQLTDAFAWIVSSASTWNSVFPLDVAFQVIIFIIAFEVVVWGFKLGVFIYDKIRGSG